MQEILRARDWEQQYPLFTTVNRIVNGYFPPTDIVNYFDVSGTHTFTHTYTHAHMHLYLCCPHELCGNIITNKQCPGPWKTHTHTTPA